MKQQRRRGAGSASVIIIVLLAVVLLAAGAAAWMFFRRGAAGQAADWSRIVAYVPLDDRTDNLEDVELLAEASGWTILLPDRDLFRTALDGQRRNANGTGHGDRESLLEWVREMDKAGCDRFILSLDQLLSGGLVHSRTVSKSWPLRFSDGAAMDEQEAFRQYILPLTEDPSNRVYLFDSVLRLSPTVGYDGVSAEEYYALREYGMTARPQAAGSLDTVLSAYPYAEDSVTRAEDALGSDKFRAYLTPELIDRYLSVRRRKLALTDSILASLSHADNAYLLIGIDDSSNRPNIQYNELRWLEQRLAECGLAEGGNNRLSGVTSGAMSASSVSRARLMPGLDSLARLLLCRMAWEEYGKDAVKASVRYIGGTEGRHSSEFDLYTLEEVADIHLDLFGAERVDEDQAELQFVVMTAPDDPSRRDACREELLSLLEENRRRRVPTVLDEASNNAYGDKLDQELLERIPYAGLVAFAGKYDQANVTGAAFAMGFSRYLYLKHGRTEPDPARDHRADLAQIQQMANSMALTEYILHVRQPLNEYVDSLGLDWNNMRFPQEQSMAPPEESGVPPAEAGDGDQIPSSTPDGALSAGTGAWKPPLERKVLRKLEALFRPDLDRVCDNLRGTRLLSGVDPWVERDVGDVDITGLYFPWNRTFETAFTVEAYFPLPAEYGDQP